MLRCENVVIVRVFLNGGGKGVDLSRDGVCATGGGMQMM